ncbi:NAD-dependent epimerase/dehydratase family protein [Prochlorococcus marinus]|uniref:NAD-dependent epimerase/dehydratase family protein n=1 Tax=Prochlorococcus marinus TaxID=1219 RepID=UPI001AD9BFE2|nr:NAD-dependent epimerase/dehydratase family protein [Prochlorococcus marinus]MBO8221443.1 NAD-dependent epimerase/dehydratase family protein [Prochlorococcus marinus CUG1417]MBW3074253.1 nucleotide sugar epimerase [Prochlorococcus marinus str. MU1417]
MQNFQTRVKNIVNYINNSGLNSFKDFYDGKTVLVTGGAGGIGSNLIIFLSQLVGENGKIVVLDNLSANRTKSNWNIYPASNILFVQGDIRNNIDLQRCFRERIEIVFHLAAFFANQNSIDYPGNSADVDIKGLINILDYSTICNVKRFIYASSGCAIYGSYPELPLKEDFISMHLTTPYQINKMAGEMYCNYYLHHFNLPIVNCRFFNSYGPGEVPGQYRNVIPNFMYWMKKSIEIPLTGDGSETRDFTYVYDLCQGLIKAGFETRAIGQNFNLASGKEVKIMDLINKVGKAFGKDYKIVKRPRRKWDTKPRLLASIKKAKDLINYEPIIEFNKGLEETFSWYHENWEFIEELADFKPGMNSAVRKRI